jgi:hypothetical protein
MKRYLLFGSDESYYAKGGANDFIGDFHHISDAVIEGNTRYNFHHGNNHYLDWFHVFDSVSRKICYKSANKPYGDNELNLHL